MDASGKTSEQAPRNVTDSPQWPPSARCVKETLVRWPRPFHPAPPERIQERPAAVLIPLVWAPSDVRVVVMRRPGRMREHGNEMAFPGGRPEASDQDLEATACREFYEELGVEVGATMGALSSIPLLTTDYRVTPFVARIPKTTWQPSVDEVAAVHEISLDRLLNAPATEAMPVRWLGEEILSPVFGQLEIPIYGATAHMLFELLGVVAKASGRVRPRLRRGDWTWERVQECRRAFKDL